VLSTTQKHKKCYFHFKISFFVSLTRVQETQVNMTRMINTSEKSMIMIWSDVANVLKHTYNYYVLDDEYFILKN